MSIVTPKGRLFLRKRHQNVKRPMLTESSFCHYNIQPFLDLNLRAHQRVRGQC